MRSSTRHLLPAAPAPSAAPVSAPTDATLDGTIPSVLSTTPFAAPGSRQSSAPLSVHPEAGTADAIDPSSGTKAPTRQPTPAKEGPTIDVKFEASKIPLDVAVVESILAASTEDRMKKICQNVLIVGGTGLIHNIGFAIQSRYAPFLYFSFVYMLAHSFLFAESLPPWPPVSLRWRAKWRSSPRPERLTRASLPGKESRRWESSIARTTCGFEGRIGKLWA